MSSTADATAGIEKLNLIGNSHGPPRSVLAL